MGKYLRMSKGAEEEVAVMEVAEIGVKMKRAREVVDGEETDVVKRRKIGEAELKPSSPAPSLPFQLENDRAVIIPVNSVAPARLAIGDAQASSCIFSQSSDLTMENLKFVDPEEEDSGFTTPKRNSDCEESGKTTPWKELPPKLVPKTAKRLKYRVNLKLIVDEPLANEMDEFFAAQEQKQLKEFAEKYNFDFENEEPLEGRYEWVKLLKP